MHRNKTSPRIKAAARIGAYALAASSLAAAASASGADPIQGLLLLHSGTGGAAMAEALPLLENQGCEVWRQGQVAGAQGNLDIGAQERFVLMSCRSAVLASASGRTVLGDLQKADDNLRAVEGPLLFRVEDEAGNADLTNRDYVLKISHYNNRNPAVREDDLERINALAGGRKDAWTNEAMIAGLRAVGMPTPDEVVVIRYDNAQQGARFRDNNGDVLKEIGAFNEKHLTEYSYISAAPDR